jgi:hypothetical protein
MNYKQLYDFCKSYVEFYNNNIKKNNKINLSDNNKVIIHFMCQMNEFMTNCDQKLLNKIIKNSVIDKKFLKNTFQDAINKTKKNTSFFLSKNLSDTSDTSNNSNKSSKNKNDDDNDNNEDEEYNCDDDCEDDDAYEDDDEDDNNEKDYDYGYGNMNSSSDEDTNDDSDLYYGYKKNIYSDPDAPPMDYREIQKSSSFISNNSNRNNSDTSDSSLGFSLGSDYEYNQEDNEKKTEKLLDCKDSSDEDKLNIQPTELMETIDMNYDKYIQSTKNREFSIINKNINTNINN